MLLGEKSVGKTRHLNFCQIPAPQIVFMHMRGTLSGSAGLSSCSPCRLPINFQLRGRKSNDSSTQNEMFNETESRKIVKFPSSLGGEMLKY